MRFRETDTLNLKSASPARRRRGNLSLYEVTIPNNCRIDRSQARAGLLPAPNTGRLHARMHPNTVGNTPLSPKRLFGV